MSEQIELAMRAAEGTLGEAEAMRLAALLRGDAGAVDAYVEAMLTGALMERELSRTRPTLVIPTASGEIGVVNAELGTRNSELAERAEPKRRNVPSFGFRVSSFAYAAAAALMVAGAAAAIYFGGFNTSHETGKLAPIPPIATVIDTESTGGAPLNAGDALYHGPVPLERGTIDLMMNSGVSVGLTGPGEFELVDAMSMRVMRGRARCVVPAGAAGFTVSTPDGVRIVDLGTEFIVRVDESGRSFVGVLRGSVRIDRDEVGGIAAKRELIAGEAAVVVDGGEVRPAVLVQGSLVVESIRVDPVVFNATSNRRADGDEAPGLSGSFTHSALLADEAIEEVFGKSSGGIEPGNVMFVDSGVADNGNDVIGDGDETVDWVEWRTGEAVTLGGYRVELATDGAEDGSPRCVRMMRLIVEGRVMDEVSVGGRSGEVIRFFEGGPVTGRRFRVEFTRGTAGRTNAGPRVVEIDAVNVTATPAEDSGATGGDESPAASGEAADTKRNGLTTGTTLQGDSR